MKQLLSNFINLPAHPVVVGIAGLAATQTAHAMDTHAQTLADATQAGDPVTVIIQIVIGIATLWKLFRKNKNGNGNN